MKSVRLLIAVLLAVLLPIQGALAAAMRCPHETASPRVVDRSNADDAAMDHEAMHHGPAMVGHAKYPDRGSAEPHDGKCGLCAACCAGPALLSVGSTDVGFVRPPADTFSHVRLPAASFLSGGQDRPPRSC